MVMAQLNGLSDSSVKTILQDLVKYDLEVKALIQDMRDCDGKEKELDGLQTLIKERMTKLKAHIEKLERIAYDQDKETDKDAILKEVKAHTEQAASTQQAFRRANIAGRMLIDKLNREALMTRQNPDLRKRQKRDKEELVKSTSNITSSIQSVNRLMTSQVQQSENIIHSLVNSSKTLTDTQEEFKSMGGVIQQSHKLLTKYNRREFTDKILIFISLAFFFACVLYVVKKRLF